MNKGYKFQDKEINSLNELGVCYTENFNDAITDVFYNTKKLIRFIRSKNKKLAKEIISIITSCKYQNNVLTLIIFNLREDKAVVINGVILSFKELIFLIKKYGSKHKAIYAFMEDLGITRTYATLNIEPNLVKDSYYIEKNIHDTFVYEYLTSFYEFDYVESLKSFISNVFIYDDERYRRASKIVRNERFELLLAHKTGFKEVFDMRMSQAPLFMAVKLLAVEFEESELRKLIDDTFYWWLLDNFDKYTFKRKSKETLKEIKNCISAKKKIEKKYTFTSYVDLANDVFNVYLKFVAGFKDGSITVKKKFSVEEYTIDKFYCKTYICANFMKDHTVKLQKENLNSEGELTPTEEIIKDETDEDNEEEYEVKNHAFSLNNLKMLGKMNFKMKRFAGWSMFMAIFCAMLFAVYLICSMTFTNIEIFKTDALGLPLGIALLSICFVVIILVTVLFGKIAKSLNSIDCLTLLENTKNKDIEYGPERERVINQIKENEEFYQKKAKRYHRVLSTIVLMGIGCILSGIAIVGLSLLVGKVSILPADKVLDTTGKIIGMCIGAVLGVSYGSIRKRKGALTVMLISLLSIAGVVAIAFVL